MSATTAGRIPLRDGGVERELRIQFLRQPDDSVLNAFHVAIEHLADRALGERLLRAWEFARSLEYHHPGQSKEVYLAHPLRVAVLYTQLVHPVDEAGLVTAMLHNVLEVSNVDRAGLARFAGDVIADAVATLTVDRAMQWDHDYKDAYYRRIESSPAFVAKVKIFDKLDNLFLLCLNPSDQTRALYLDEIDKWLVPMTVRVLPALVPYLCNLVTENRRLGHRPLKTSLASNGADHGS